MSYSSLLLLAVHPAPPQSHSTPSVGHESCVAIGLLLKGLIHLNVDFHPGMAVGFLQYHYLGAEYLNYFVAPCPCIGELKGLAFALMVLLEHHLLQELQHKLHFYDVLLAPFFSINVLKSAPPPLHSLLSTGSAGQNKGGEEKDGLRQG